MRGPWGFHIKRDTIPYLPFFICRLPTSSLGRQAPFGGLPAPQPVPALHSVSTLRVACCFATHCSFPSCLCFCVCFWRLAFLETVPIPPDFISPIWGCGAAAAGSELISANLVLVHLQTRPTHQQMVFLEDQKHPRINISGRIINEEGEHTHTHGWTCVSGKCHSFLSLCGPTEASKWVFSLWN